MLILKSPSENQNYCTHPAQEKKKKETNSVDTDITLTGVFAAEAVIMLLEIWT